MFIFEFSRLVYAGTSNEATTMYEMLHVGCSMDPPVLSLNNLLGSNEGIESWFADFIHICIVGELWSFGMLDPANAEMLMSR